MSARWAVWILTAAASGPSCGSKDCDENAYALTVSVVDASVGEPICGATVTASADSHNEQLTTSISCTYVGLRGRSGTFLVRAERVGFTTKDVSITILADECGPRPRHVTIELEPGT